MARGRKRKSGKRHPSGKLVQPGAAETQREIMATVLEARQRRFEVSERQARDERLGSVLGRLAFAQLITPEQYAAGQAYLQVCHRHHAVMGWPMPFPASVSGLLAGQGALGGAGPPPTRELVEKVREDYRAVRDVVALCDRERARFPGDAPGKLLDRLASTSDESAGSWPQSHLANLSAVLDALADHFGIQRE